MTFYTINQNGIEQIKSFLKNNLKGFDNLGDSEINAWASEVEDSRNDNEAGVIEIRSWDSVSGHTVSTTITDEGFDAE